MDLNQSIKNIDGKLVVSVLDSPTECYGNVSLSNRFLTVMLKQQYELILDDGSIEEDDIGGNGGRFIGINIVRNDDQALIGAITISIEETVESMIATESEGIPDTERISEAFLSDLYIDNNIVYAEIEIVPVEVEEITDLKLRVPIIRRGV